MEEQRFSSWVLERIVLGDLVRLRVGVTTVGRNANCDVKLPKSPFVSRQHAEIHVSENHESIYIKDLNSSNGIFINDKLFKNSTAQIKAGDKIGIGVLVEDDECSNEEFPIYILKSLSLNVEASRSSGEQERGSSLTDNLCEKQPKIPTSDMCLVASKDPPVLSLFRETPNVKAQPLSRKQGEKDISMSREENAFAKKSELIEKETKHDTSDSYVCHDARPPEDTHITLENDVESFINKLKTTSLSEKSVQKDIVKASLIDIEDKGNECFGQTSTMCTNSIEIITLSSDEEDIDKEQNSAIAKCSGFNMKSFSNYEPKIDGIKENKLLSNDNTNNNNLISDYNDFDNISFSQMMLDEMKEELADPDPSAKVQDENEPQSNIATSAFDKLKQSEYIDDENEEEEYDAELEIKVEHWSEKLFSQSFSQSSGMQTGNSKKEKENTVESCTIPDFLTENNTKSRESFSKICKNLNGLEKEKLRTNSCHTESSSIEKKSPRGPPSVIEPPHLPKNKGKLRGVSAISEITKKRARIHDDMKNDRYKDELKQKWLEKPSVSSETMKERAKKLKEERKERLKQVANQEKLYDSHKRKKPSHNQETVSGHLKRPKIKLTTENRGAFLAKEVENDPVKLCKIPKISKEKQNNQKVGATSSSTTAKQSATITKRRSTILFEHPISSKNSYLISKRKDGIPASTYKEKEEARATRTTNKITFSSMEINYQQTAECKEKLGRIQRNSKDLEPKHKKRVRFNDTPTIHYIEARGANKKVDRKDIMPMSRIRDRRHNIRRTYPIVDFSEKITSDLLAWSTEWYQNINSPTKSSPENVYPMTNEFSSFENYKNVILSLMKLEYLTTLERAYNRKESVVFKVRVERTTSNNDRLLLTTKSNCNDKRSNISSMDIVLLEFVGRTLSTFGFVLYTRKNVDESNTIVIEVMANKHVQKHLGCNPEIRVRTLINNIRVDVGAFNSVYQLKCTPLFNKIVNPMELLKINPCSKNIIYKGCDDLNKEQKDILLDVYSTAINEKNPTISLIQGPPGTGKTRVITNLALQILYGDEALWMDRKVLICAQSNGAIDVIAQKLYNIQQRMEHKKFQLIRFGKPDKINKNVNNITLPKLVEKEQMTKLLENCDTEIITNLKAQILQLQEKITNYEKNYHKETSQEDSLNDMHKQLKIMQNAVDCKISPEEEKKIYTRYLCNSNIVCTTLSSCLKLSQYIDYFDICIIDEATQSTEPWTLVPLKFGVTGLILVGDTQQLPAIVLSKRANDLGLGTSLFTRIQRCLETANSQNIIYKLKIQYRMHPEICKWPNFYFYKDELSNGPCTSSFDIKITPFSILSLGYSQNNNCNEGQIENDMEAAFITNLVKALNVYMPIKNNAYGIITPYAQQRNKLESSFRAAGLDNVMINTIDFYQGIEKDVIIISNARTQGIGFLDNPQRLNVALTRSRKCLILCGNFRSLEGVTSWKSLLKNARDRNLYHEIKVKDEIKKTVIDKLLIKR